MTVPDFSPFAEQYARSRPAYPAELFQHLVSLVDPRRLAWDCATGNGQAAVHLAEEFDRVVATDISEAQIGQAVPHPRIEYRVAPSDRSGFDDRSVDLVTVAAAIHWFDLDRFYTEVRRVLRPGGVVAAWTYHVCYLEPPFDEIFLRFYHDTLRDYFAPEVRIVDNRYNGLTLPGDPLPIPPFSVTAEWTLEQMLAFIASWSGTQSYIQQNGRSPLETFARELEDLWGSGRQTVRWPLYARVARL